MTEKTSNSTCLTLALILCSVTTSLARDNGELRPASLVGMISLIVREPVLRELQIEQDSQELLKIRLLLKPFPMVLQERLNHPLESDRDEKLTPQEVYSKVEAEFVEKLRDLLTPTQFARLQQIHWQRWGIQALHDGELAEALEITPIQTERLNTVRTEYESQKRDLESQLEEARAQGADFSDFKRRLQSIEKERTKAYDEVLSDEQRIRFAELKGRTFDLAPADPAPRRGSVVSLEARSGGVVFLVSKEPVQRELGIENQPSRLAELRDLAAAYSSELNQERQKSNLAERRNARELESKLQEKYVVELKKLLTLKQFQRLQQIYWQQLGNEALSDVDIAAALEITADQQQQIAALNQELVQKVRLLVNIPGGKSGASAVGDQLQKQVLAAKRELDNQVLQVLTESQRVKFEELKGILFDLDLLKSRLLKDSAQAPQKK